jgi:2Fe-2S ferredoxin
MTRIIFLPHPETCPEGMIVEAHSGENLIEVALAHGIELEHACEMSCACTTCHVIVREGFDSLEEADETEDDLLDKAWGLEAESRLSCQIEIGAEDLVIEIPKYTLNQVSEAG